MIDVSRAEQILGWMTELELLWLAEQAQRHKVIVEVGSYLGRSTRALADNTSGIVYAVDDFYGPRDVTVYGREYILDEFMSNMAGLEGRLHVIQKDHSKLETSDFPQRPDMVFIDGEHTAEAVSRDVEFWLENTSPGALLCGHDYGQPAFPGIEEVVNNLFPNVSVAPNTSIWFVELSSHPYKTVRERDIVYD